MEHRKGVELVRNNKALGPGKTCEHPTPQAFFDKLDAEFHFDLDVCATRENAKCAFFYTKFDDGLSMFWWGNVFMNPPYGRELGKWMKKAYESSQQGATVVCLVPSRTETAWWHDYAMKGEIRFVRGRLKFGKSKTTAPFPSSIIIFRSK